LDQVSIKVRGHQVAPAELEGHLLITQSSQTLVIGISDEYSRELPLAFIIVRPGLVFTASANLDFARDIRNLKMDI
jgi:4-coumarate--CoA ligase